MNRGEFLSAIEKSSNTAKITPVELAGFGTVYVREMSGKEHEEYSTIVAKAQATNQFDGSKAALIQMCLCDEGRHPLFQKSERGIVAKMPAKAFNKLWIECLKHNALDEESEDDLLGNLPQANESEPGSQ